MSTAIAMGAAVLAAAVLGILLWREVLRRSSAESRVERLVAIREAYHEAYERTSILLYDRSKALAELEKRFAESNPTAAFDGLFGPQAPGSPAAPGTVPDPSPAPETPADPK